MTSLGSGQEGYPLVGVAIAVHNRVERTRECLLALSGSDYSRLFICVVDDGSTDGTWDMLAQEFSQVRAIRGNGSLWWAGATNLAIEACMEARCDYVLLLNPDCIVYPDTVCLLVSHALVITNSVIACVAVDQAHPDVIWWGGTEWGPMKLLPIVWTFKYRYKRGRHVQELPDKPFDTADTGGRGILIPRSILNAVGLLDDQAFPHYGADNDFGLRVRKTGFRILVAPDARVRLYIGQSGHAPATSVLSLPKDYLQRLISRKHGESLRCNWRLLKRHVPPYAVLPSYLAWFALLTWRYWSMSLAMIGRESHSAVVAQR